MRSSGKTLGEPGAAGAGRAGLVRNKLGLSAIGEGGRGGLGSAFSPVRKTFRRNIGN